MLASSAFVLLVLFHCTRSEDKGNGRNVDHTVHAYEDGTALLTCVMHSVENNGVIWKRNVGTRRNVLTAGDIVITKDSRFSVIHEPHGDVWVLSISKVKTNDSGIYTCEVNSPPLMTVHQLRVLSRNPLVAPAVEEITSLPPISKPSHNYTDCCVALNVSSVCLGFCSVHNILHGYTGTDPENCEHDFPAIVRCMADGRNHVPCCIREGVPDICQDVCMGEYTVITDNVKTHFSCAAYTEPTLGCISLGVELLPSVPLEVQLTPKTDSSILVEWTPPFKNSESVIDYVINVTMLKSFDPNSLLSTQGPEFNSSQSIVTTHTIQVKVKASVNESNEVIVNDLTPLTMYEVSVTATNKHGSSLPSFPVRSLTLLPGDDSKGIKLVPQLPDIRQCCVNKGITPAKCLEKLCDLSLEEVMEVTDLMICAPWAEHAFSCLANGVDHTPCCMSRGLPPVCQQICSGNLTQLNFNHFKCLKHIPVYRSCLMKGYGVLPSEPKGVKVVHPDTDFAIVYWSPPHKLPESVLSYNVHYRIILDEQYSILYEVKPPYILEGLKSDTVYEVYITANNFHGTGDPSQRVVFSTKSKALEEKVEEAENGYNVTGCCVKAGVSSVCLALCSYDASMTQLKSLGAACAPEFTKLLRCGVGGRNHEPCCRRRGVHRNCLGLCSGVLNITLDTVSGVCSQFVGNMILCFEEGTGLLPGPVTELHAVKITDSLVKIVWEPPSDGSNITGYIVHYRQVDNASMQETTLKLDNQKFTPSTSMTLDGLETGQLYNIFVVSENNHGTSLPSSILLINITSTDLDGSKLSAVISPPHFLAVSARSATYVTFTWQPPQFSHPEELITYNVHFKSNADGQFDVMETTLTSHTLKNLSPNTQYIVYITATSSKGESLPSETLVAWTDPAYPAFVEPPTVHPINLVVEGSSMTILCIAMGTPMPTISLYISGRFVRQEITRHMVTVIKNVTRDMNYISCYADNGYGTPMEAKKKIIISYKPHINPSGITMAAQGETVSLQCEVESYPQPAMMFWRDLTQRIPVITGGKYEVNTEHDKEEENRWLMKLTIKKITGVDDGDYYCHAENAFGNTTKAVSVRIRNVAAATNVTQCCIERNVSSLCMDACSFYLDIDAVIDKPECITDFDKLMKCGSDGSDHRSCCVHSGVERSCLDWCRGEPLFGSDHKMCLLRHTKKIISCFREGRDHLPGTPINVKAERIDDHSVFIKWDPPLKNPHTVEMYRVFWRPAGTRTGVALKNDTKDTKLKITGLKSGVMYECVVKAGNRRGTSTQTEPLQFSTDEKYITSAASIGGEQPTYGMTVGVLFAVCAMAAIVIGAVWFVRMRNMQKSSNGVAFENPSYLREVNMDHVQSCGGGDGSTGGWRQEQLHVPPQSEVPPSLYEELKLGHDGVGFKRLKP